jgi:hypothetical protein
MNISPSKSTKARNHSRKWVDRVEAAIRLDGRLAWSILKVSILEERSMLKWVKALYDAIGLLCKDMHLRGPN